MEKKDHVLEKEEWEKINDISKNEFENVTDNDLLKCPALNRGDKTKIEMNRRLKNEIKRFNILSSRYSNRMFWITIVLGILAVIQIGLLVYQILS